MKVWLVNIDYGWWLYAPVRLQASIKLFNIHEVSLHYCSMWLEVSGAAVHLSCSHMFGSFHMEQALNVIHIGLHMCESWSHTPFLYLQETESVDIIKPSWNW